MPREYIFLSQEEQDDIIAEYMLAQERDLFCHELNLQRFEAMLPNLPAGEYKQRIQNLRNETIARIAEVQAIIAETEKQLPPSERLLAAKQRIEQKIAQQRGVQPPQGIQ